MTICSITMGGVAFIEFLQIIKEKLEYFKDLWNYFDVLLIISWYSLYLLRAYQNFEPIVKDDKLLPDYTSEIISMNMLRTAVVILSFIKIISYMRTFQGFASLIMMLRIVIHDLRYF